VGNLRGFRIDMSTTMATMMMMSERLVEERRMVLTATP